MCVRTLQAAWYMLSIYRVSRTECSAFTCWFATHVSEHALCDIQVGEVPTQEKLLFW